MSNRDYHQERREYQYTELTRDELSSDPFLQFSKWMDQAIENKIIDPTAMSVSTVDLSGQPHSRIVLLKESDSNGFVFYTHYDSDKGQQIADNANAALLFYWPQLDRQIRIEGQLEKTSKQQSENYFHSRPRESQLAAASSVQSRVVPGRKTLNQNFALKEQIFEHTDVECPEHWGGYILKPNRFEFWQGRPNRLHDRFVFTKGTSKNNQAWSIDRLAP
ncbi:MAG TPA: pyridoxamine 5'-phosphate oxidase [Thiomicrospira sp.]|jgi:pyridoxamine-phosphate oxidase|nr:pyridoxamine 5'-phosphate oxidase [Thiomicrospira sp.]